MSIAYTKLCKGYPVPHVSYRLIHPKKSLCRECQLVKNEAVKRAIRYIPKHTKPVAGDDEYRLEGFSAALRIWKIMMKS